MTPSASYLWTDGRPGDGDVSQRLPQQCRLANDMAMKAHDPQRESLCLAAAQVAAIQAIAAAVDRLATAIEATGGRP
jgi:hypothetical protein